MRDLTNEELEQISGAGDPTGWVVGGLGGLAGGTNMGLAAGLLLGGPVGIAVGVVVFGATLVGTGMYYDAQMSQIHGA